MTEILVRNLVREDIKNGFLAALDALRPASHMTHDACYAIYDDIKDDPNRVVAVAVLNGYIVGTASLILERKFIHDGGRAAHIEDVSVNSKFQGQSVGRLLIQYLLDVALHSGCYKTTLDCKDDVAGFYQRLGFVHNGLSMRIDHM